MTMMTMTMPNGGSARPFTRLCMKPMPPIRL